MAEGGGLLNRYRLVKAYRGFESLRLRQFAFASARQAPFASAGGRITGIPAHIYIVCGCAWRIARHARGRVRLATAAANIPISARASASRARHHQLWRQTAATMSNEITQTAYRCALEQPAIGLRRRRANLDRRAQRNINASSSRRALRQGQPRFRSRSSAQRPRGGARSHPGGLSARRD